MITEAAVATLIGGILIGYMGQRSGFCIPSGIRDFYMFKNTYLVKTIPGILIGAFISFIILSRTGAFMPNYPLLWDVTSGLSMALAIIGGLGIGFFSVIADGCPFRQFVMASEGKKKAFVFIAGFLIGLIYYNTVLGTIINAIQAVLG